MIFNRDDLAKVAKNVKLLWRSKGQNNSTKILGCITVTVLIISLIYIYSLNSAIYLIKSGTKEIGYIKGSKTYKDIYDRIKNTDGEKSASLFFIEKAKNEPKKILGTNEMEMEIRNKLNLKLPSVAIYADGVEMVRVGNNSDANKTIDGLKKLYYPKTGKNNYSIISCSIKEKIITKNVYAKKDEILDVDDAIEKIDNGKQSSKAYIIKKGDTIWDISLKNDVDVDDIQSANPSININKIKPGDKIKIGCFAPYINVNIKANINSKEQVPYNVATVYDGKLAKGIKKIKRPGRNGIVDVSKSIEIINGDVVNENVLKTTTIAGVIDEIQIIGKKVPVKNYYSYAGFIRPSRGRLSSSFGRRWGRLHAGIDLSGPTGSPISAANSGRVVFAGWRNGYGKCVVISHGGGYQTLYGHSSKLYVKVGQMVKKGQKIAAVGSTGRSTGPHVHFEVRKNGAPVNPIKYIH